MNVLRTLLLAGCVAGAAASPALAQTQTFDNVARIGRSAISPIYAGNEVKGYIFYAKGDKADRSNDNYRLDFFDQDLNKVKSITIQKPSGKYYLLANSFNGTAFALYFFNRKEETLELETYNTSLEKIGTKVIGELNKGDKMAIMQAMQQQGGGDSDTPFGGLDLFPVPGYGFIRNSFEGLGKGFNLQMYDDKLQPKWRIAADPKSKYYEAINLTEANGKYVLATMLRREGLFSRTVNAYLVALDAATGRKVLEQPVETGSGEQLSVNSFTYDPDKHEFVVLGEYYAANDKPFVNKSQGFFIKRFSEAGKQSFVKSYSWDKDVKNALPAEARASVEDGFVNYPQAIVRGANGSTYLVTEQYKIVGDGLGIAITALGGRGASLTKGKIGNMLVFSLDPSYNLTGIKFYPKDPSPAYIPPAATAAGTGLTGHFFRSTGQFDYQFLQKNDANSQFNAVYINYDKEKGEKTKKIIGNMAFTDAGQFKLDKVDATGTATATYLYPAKPGYLMLVDYLKKENKVGMKLVKLNI